MSADLKPCPFCGGDNFDLPGLTHVECRDCGARGPSFSVGQSPAKLWNGRHEPLSLDEREARIAEAIRQLGELRETFRALAAEIKEGRS